MPDARPAMQFSDLQQQEATARLGMWVFLATEVLFFGGLATAYLAYRTGYGDAFAAAGRRTEIVIGTANTAILLTSSFLVAWALVAARARSRDFTALLLALAAVLGLIFIALKGVEYSKEFEEHLVPGINFAVTGPLAGGIELFFVLYFVATGVHAIHLAIGIVVLGVMARRAKAGEFADYQGPLTVAGLYWHFVDMIWIFLFAFIYLPGRSGP
ncbi:MAG TPA: cytochrome c oxidase subunit 3 [Pseudolabrys sp.]|nr:cytochrome c oxidase subunit 3 [Pseudolabrys sp.]